MIKTLAEQEVRTQGGSILVVDDELGPRESLRILLKNDYEMHCADNVDEGVETFRRHSPDLVIFDIRMPGKSGIDGLRLIRELDADVSVVMLTGFGALETAQEALRLGANDYLRKPFDTDQIREVVGRYVQRTQLVRRKETAARQLERLNAELADQLAAKEHLATMGQASAEFAHDLKNPLTVVIGYLTLLNQQMASLRETLGEPLGETLEYLDIIEKNVNRCFDLAETWRGYSRGESNSQQVVDLHALLAELVTGVGPLAGSCGAVLAFLPAEGHLHITAVPSQLLRALHNVLANALQAVSGRAEGRVEVATQREGAQAEILIRDNGSGMPEDVRKRALDPYFTTKPDGTGLGLHITREIVENHQGKIHIDSEVGRGTRVTLVLAQA